MIVILLSFIGALGVFAASTLSSLTIEDGGIIKGIIQIDGKEITPSSGKTFTGKIPVIPL